ncbi:MAG: phosphoribosylglycinamide formyltransferase [Gammaproteobacteria bacterium]|nr:phosphoribosylglycinamide formyltransferase [Gammaproteobacteria bacterium]
MNESATPLPVVVLLSGSGTTLQAILDEIKAGTLKVELKAVISDQPDAAGLGRAEDAGIETCALLPGNYAERQEFDRALASCIDKFKPKYIVLAGYMRILSESFVERFAGKILNIHPSLLPRFRGLNTYTRVLEAGDAEHGSSVHFVTAELDGGPLIMQARVAILAQDTEESLSARVKEQERKMYPAVLNMLAAGRLEMKDGKTWLDQRVLERPMEYTL